MAGIKIGYKECPITEIAKFCLYPPMDEILMDNWKKFAIALKLPSYFIKATHHKLKYDTITSHDIASELLIKWLSVFSCEATIGNLLKIIMENFDWKIFEDFLREKIQQNANSWDDLDDQSKEEILSCKTQFLGKEQTLNAIKSQIKPDDFYNALKEHSNKNFIQKALKHDVLQLDKVNLPHKLTYHINRTLTWKRKLNPALFKTSHPDIFLIDDIKRPHLFMLAPEKPTDISTNQLRNLNAKIILLELEYDFEKIVNQATAPVHRIQYKDDNFYWKFTVGSLQVIHSFLLDNEYEEISEQDLVEMHLTSFSSRPHSIVSCPGMGKSVILQSLAHRVLTSFPERIVLFIEMESFFQHSINQKQNKNLIDISELITSYICENDFGQRLIRKLFHDEDKKFEIFLDGFDEIPVDQVEFAKEILTALRESKNIRAHITSRPHLRTELEDTIGVVSFDIVPFQRTDQINFLCGFWKKSLKTENVEQLSSFANMAVENISSDYIGIPLQCFMLANIYSEQVKRYLKSGANDCEIINQSKSIFDLYNKFIRMKFGLVPSSDENLIRRYHWILAIKLLFSWDKFAMSVSKVLENEKGQSSSSFELTAYKVGILEKGRMTNDPVFIHRTLAEFFVADLIAEYFKGNVLLNCTEMGPFVIESVLAICADTQCVMIQDDCLEWVVETIESSSTWTNDPFSKKRLGTALLPELDIAPSMIRKLKSILIVWRRQRERKGTFGALVNQLNDPHWKDVVDDLKKNISKYSKTATFAYSTICLFLDANLSTNQDNLFGKKKNKHVALHYNTNNFYKKCLDRLYLLTQKNHRHLLAVVTLLIFDKPVNPIEYTDGRLLLNSAAFTGDLEIFLCCCDIIDKYSKISYAEFSFSLGKFKNKEYEQTPLHIALSSGGLNLCAYLINKYGKDKLAKLPFLYEYIVIDSYTDSATVIQNKIDLIKLLHSNNICVDVAQFKETFDFCTIAPELFITLSDLMNYSPSEQDEEYILKIFQFGIRNDAKMNLYVDWLVKMEKIRFLMTDCASMLANAIACKGLEPQTLKKIYELYPDIDLGNILFAAIAFKRADEFVKLIVDISGNVNITNSEGRTMLSYSLLYVKPEIFSYLLSVGAKIHAKDFEPICLKDHILGRFWSSALNEIVNVTNAFTPSNNHNSSCCFYIRVFPRFVFFFVLVILFLFFSKFCKYFGLSYFEFSSSKAEFIWMMVFQYIFNCIKQLV